MYLTHLKSAWICWVYLQEVSEVCSAKKRFLLRVNLSVTSECYKLFDLASAFAVRSYIVLRVILFLLSGPKGC